jgi:hypothetical protein
MIDEGLLSLVSEEVGADSELFIYTLLAFWSLLLFWDGPSGRGRKVAPPRGPPRGR